VNLSYRHSIDVLVFIFRSIIDDVQTPLGLRRKSNAGGQRVLVSYVMF